MFFRFAAICHLILGAVQGQCVKFCQRPCMAKAWGQVALCLTALAFLSLWVSDQKHEVAGPSGRLLSEHIEPKKSVGKQHGEHHGEPKKSVGKQNGEEHHGEPTIPVEMTAPFQTFAAQLKFLSTKIWDFFSTITLWKVAPAWCSWFGYFLCWVLWLATPLLIEFGFFFLGAVVSCQCIHEKVPLTLLVVVVLNVISFLIIALTVHGEPTIPVEMTAPFQTFAAQLKFLSTKIWDFFSTITLWKVAPAWCSWFGYFLCWVLWLATPLLIEIGSLILGAELGAGLSYPSYSGPGPFSAALLFVVVLNIICFCMIALTVHVFVPGCADPGRDVVNGQCILRTCACNNGTGFIGAACPEAGAEFCRACDDGWSLPLAYTCSTKNMLQLIFCKRMSQTRPNTCVSGISTNLKF